MRSNTMLEKLTAIAAITFIGVFFYYAFYPFQVTQLNSIGIDKAAYCRGEWVQIEIDFTKYVDIQAEVQWFIVDGIVYQLDSPGITRPVGENKIIVSKQVPQSILPGRYNMRVEMEYKVHPLHGPIVNVWDTPKFEVMGNANCPDKVL